jgi:DNA-binding transcriptional MerR regulator
VSVRSYLSIGDVLTLLRQEFPDITISKIRFLESQGLVNPERTPSGYRKFYEHDVERLRWVLRQQREHFLPLKVIKDRLEGGTEGTEVSNGTEETSGSNGNEAEEATAPTPASGTSIEAIDARVRAAGAASADPAQPTSTDQAAPRTRTTQPDRTDPDEAAQPERAEPVLVGQASSVRAPGLPADPPATGSSGPALPGIEDGSDGPPSGSDRRVSSAGRSVDRPARTSGAARSSRSGGSPGETPPSAEMATPQREPASEGPSEPPPSPIPGGGASSRSGGSSPPEGRSVDLSGASLTLAELAAASGLGEDVIEQLREYGFLVATQVGGADYFDEECLAIANLAAGFARYGVEPRHLRLYKNTADREAGFIEQIVLPLVRQRNPEARQRAGRTAEELTQLGQGLRSALLRTAIRDLLGG